VLTTWTLCTITDARRVLRAIRRVLRGDGRFIFVEHGARRIAASSGGKIA
jgi:SAM-dependent methyltransferase